jgi:hypothetical protein
MARPRTTLVSEATETPDSDRRLTIAPLGAASVNYWGGAGRAADRSGAGLTGGDRISRRLTPGSPLPRWGLAGAASC